MVHVPQRMLLKLREDNSKILLLGVRGLVSIRLSIYLIPMYCTYLLLQFYGSQLLEDPIIIH